MNSPRLFVAAAVLAVLGATASPAAAAQATVATLSPVVLPSLSGGTAFADGVNSAGVIVGSSTTSTGEFHAVVWRNGGIEDLGTLGGGSSEAYDINDQGKIVGESLAADNRYHAVMWQEVTSSGGRGHKPPKVSWKITDLGALGDGPWAEARDINNTGAIVGRYTIGQDFTAQFQGSRGFILRGGTATTLNLDPGVLPSAVNDADQVVGTYRYNLSSTGITGRAFLWQNGTSRDLGTLGGQTPTPYAINNSGQVVGEGAGANGRSVGFIWENGSIRQLPIDQPNVPSYFAVSINDVGKIAGTAVVDTLTERALFWASPDAQPQTLETPAGHDSAFASTVGPQGWVLGYAIRPTSTSIAESAVVWR
jgi:probable HAF family extracellular repeat protein